MSSTGFVNAQLGSSVALTSSVLNASARYLGIQIDAAPELSPRSRLVAVPYAYFAQAVDGATGGQISGYLELSGHLIANADNGWPAVRGISALNLGSGCTGVYGLGSNSPYINIGVQGLASDANGTSNSAAIYGLATSFGGSVWAGYFDGWANVTGNLYAGAKFFKIDDPLDPAQSTLQHACVESDQYKNVYDGVVTTDANGRATVSLPEWVEALNTDFRYQLTAMGQFSQVIVSQEIANGQFVVASDKPRVKVSWQVTGVRNDAYAKAHPFEPRQLKPVGLRGKYLHPKELGVDEALGVDYAVRREGEERLKAAKDQ